MEKTHSEQTNKHERVREIHGKQDHVFLFTINKDNWPTRRNYLSHVTSIIQNGRLPAKITKISPILQEWFLYSVNTYRYDI